MAHYLRYLVSDPRGLSWTELDEALRAFDAAYRIEQEGSERRLCYGDGVFGRMTLAQRGDPFFAEEFDDLQAAMEHIPLQDRKTVRQVMQHTQALIVLRVVWENRDTESTLERIQPLWDWLLAHRTGLLQVDTEGYYGPSGLILVVR